MCGIVGCVGDKDVVSTLVDGIKKLEYRGYDSYGLCALTKDDYMFYKSVGTISHNPRFADGGSIFKGDYISGIGHTRWATHGEVSDENAHPQHNKDQTIFVVHNGIVEKRPFRLS